MTRHRPPARGLLALAIVAVLPGCGTDPLSTLSERVTGLVTGPDGPIEGAEVRLADPDQELSFAVRTDRLGRFDLPVNPGAYHVVVLHLGVRAYYSKSGAVASPQDADVLVVESGAGTVAADFVLGRLEIEVQLRPGSTGGLLQAVFMTSAGIPIGFHSEPVIGETVTLASLAPPDDYRVRLERVGIDGVFRYWLPDVFDEAVATPFTVGPALTTTETHAMPEPTAVRLDLGGQWEPGSGAQLSLWADEARHLAGVWDFTEAPAVFELVGSGPVRARVELESAGTANTWIGGSSFADATVFEASPGGEIDLGTLLVNAVELMIDRGTDWSLDVVHFVLFNQESQLSINVLTDQPATRLHLLAAGPYTLQVRHAAADQTWAQQWYDRSPVRSGARPIEIAGGGELVNVTVTLERGGVIEGRVIGTDEGAVANTLVRLEHFDGPWSWLVASGEDGSFRMTGVPDGYVFLNAQRSGENTVQWYPGVPHRDQAEPFLIESAAAITGIEFTLMEVNAP